MSIAHAPQTNQASTQEQTNAQAAAQFGDLKKLVHEIAKDWGWVLAAGIISVVGGTAALLSPVLATGIVGMFIAVTLFVVGCFNLAGVCFAEKGLKLEAFLTGTVQILLAAVMAFYPFATLMSLTFLIAALMLVDGILRVVLAIQARDIPGWGWTMAGGVAGIALSILVMTALPQASFLVIGILVGVNLITAGVARIVIAMAARKVAKATE